MRWSGEASTFEQTPEGEEGVDGATIWGKNTPGAGTLSAEVLRWIRSDRFEKCC